MLIAIVILPLQICGKTEILSGTGKRSQHLRREIKYSKALYWVGAEPCPREELGFEVDILRPVFL